MALERAAIAAQAETVARLIALGRVGLGVAATFAPRLTGRLLLGDASQESAVAVQMLGGRDAALGLGTLFAARRRGPAAVRGWTEAGALADAVDALAFARGTPTGPRRTLTVLVAGSAALAGVVLARLLSDDRGGGPA